jgi:syntaxin-binding protein 1
LAALPQYQELKEKFALHTSLCQDLITIFQEYQHDKLAKLEQDIATGWTTDGKKVGKLVAKEVEGMLTDRNIS